MLELIRRIRDHYRLTIILVEHNMPLVMELCERIQVLNYGHVNALSGVSIEVRDGELVALLGANGAGKSMTLMTISGIVRPRAGSVTYDGADLARASPYDIVRLGVIHCPEGRRIFRGLSVQENLFPVLAQRRNQ